MQNLIVATYSKQVAQHFSFSCFCPLIFPLEKLERERFSTSFFRAFRMELHLWSSFCSTKIYTFFSKNNTAFAVFYTLEYERIKMTKILNATRFQAFMGCKLCDNNENSCFRKNDSFFVESLNKKYETLRIIVCLRICLSYLLT